MNYCGEIIEQKIRKATKGLGQNLVFFEETDSTNLQAKLAAEGALNGTLFVAEKQTAGRGRRGRSWVSPEGGNIYFSLLLKPTFSPDLASQVTLVMGLAVAETIGAYCGAEALIKWPNDVVIGGRKVCGILTELGLKGSEIDYLVVGVGINVGLREFPKEIAATATGLETETGRDIDRAELLAEVMKKFELLYEDFVTGGSLANLRERYDALLVNRGREVRVLDPKGEYTGIALGITDTGELMVKLPDATIENVYAGEVSVRGVYGYV